MKSKDYDHLFGLSDRGVKEVLNEIEYDDLAIVLKSMPASLKEKFFQNMSYNSIAKTFEISESLNQIDKSLAHQRERHFMNLVDNYLD